MTVAVKAVPRSRATRAVGVQAGALRVQIAAPPHEGQANAALCGYIADRAGVRARAVRIRRGSGGARKLVEVDGESGQIVARLVAAMADVTDGPA